MVGIFTGSEALDERIKDVLEIDSMIIHYPEYFTDGSNELQPVSTIVISEKLEVGDFLSYIRLLRSKNIRVVLIVLNENSVFLKSAINLGIYDIMFGEHGISPSAVRDLISSPRSFSDIYPLYERLEHEGETPPTASIKSKPSKGRRARNNEELKIVVEILPVESTEDPVEVEAEAKSEAEETPENDNAPEDEEVPASEDAGELPPPVSEPEPEENLDVFEPNEPKRSLGIFSRFGSRDDTKDKDRSGERVKTVIEEKQVHILPDDYKKFIAFFSPESTGKTELACNVALSAANNGFRTLLVDLDPSKFGVAYNFHIKEEEYLYYEQLINRKYEDQRQVREYNSLRYAHQGHKNLYVLTGHLDSQIEISLPLLIELLKEVRPDIDVFVFDIGRDLPSEIVDYILSLDGLDKYLVLTQSLEAVNLVPWKMSLGSASDYVGWNIVINRHVNISNVSESEIVSGLHSSTGGQFKVNRSYYIPDVYHGLIRRKAGRECYYGNDESFDRSIDEIAIGWMKGSVRARRPVLGLF